LHPANNPPGAFSTEIRSLSEGDIQHPAELPSDFLLSDIPDAETRRFRQTLRRIAYHVLHALERYRFLLTNNIFIAVDTRHHTNTV